METNADEFLWKGDTSEDNFVADGEGYGDYDSFLSDFNDTDFDELEGYLEQDVKVEITDEIKDTANKYRETFYLNFGGLLPFNLIKEKPEDLKRVILLGRITEKSPKNLENYYKSLLPLKATMDINMSKLEGKLLTDSMLLNNYFEEGLKAIKQIIDYNSFDPFEFVEENTISYKNKSFDEVLTTPEISYKIKSYIDRLMETNNQIKAKQKVEEFINKVVSKPTSLNIDTNKDGLIELYNKFVEKAYYSDESIPINDDIEELSLLATLGLPSNLFLETGKGGEPVIITGRDIRIKKNFRFEVDNLTQEDINKFTNTISVMEIIHRGSNIKILQTVLNILLYYIYFKNSRIFGLTGDILTNINYV